MDNSDEDIRTNAIQDGLRKYLAAAMAALEVQYPRLAELPLRFVRGYDRPTLGHLVPKTRRDVYWRAVVRHSVEVLDPLPESRELIRVLVEHAERGPMVTPLAGADLFGVRHVDPATLVRAVLELALSSGNAIEGDGSGVDFAVRESLRYFASPTILFQVLAPLHGFHAEFEELELEHDLSIVRLRDEDWEWLDPATVFQDAMTLGQEEYALRRRIAFQKSLKPSTRIASLPDHDRVVQEDFAKAVSTLRMFQAGAVGFSYYRWGPAEWNPTPASVWRQSRSPNQLLGSPYRMDGPNAFALENFFKSHSVSTSSQGRLSAALRWFNSSYERLRVEERLVDYAIALEALVGDSTGDLTYRLSLRTAILVGGTAEARQDVAALVRHLYRIRSQVVHGEHVEKVIRKLQRDHDLNTFVSHCEGLVRDALRAHIARCPKGQDESFLKALDDTLLGS